MCKICFSCVRYVPPMLKLRDTFFISEIWFSYLNREICISYKFCIYLSLFQIRLVWVYLSAFKEMNNEHANYHALPQPISVTTISISIYLSIYIYIYIYINKHLPFLNLFITDWRLSIMADENFNDLNDLLSNASPWMSSLQENAQNISKHVM